MSECTASSTDGNVGLAFGIVTAAGLSTTVGAALAFVMPYSRSKKNRVLAVCLAIAAGVMLYVSFVEIFVGKTISEFEKCFEKKYVSQSRRSTAQNLLEALSVACALTMDLAT